MKLRLEIKNGPRQGTVFNLPDIYEPLLSEYPVVLESEIIQFDIVVSDIYKSAVLELYQHSIPVSMISHPVDNPGCVNFIWTPDRGAYSTNSKLFWNYFGVAELSILLLDENGEAVDLIRFQSLQVAATKSQADKVEKMFEYLANISPEALHSVFSATRHSVGFEEGRISPNHTFERIEHALIALQELLPVIIQNPLTRLVPEQRLTPVNGREEMDDSSIGWLLENLSVLEPTDRVEDAHLSYEGEHYKANALLLPVLDETSDIYENWVVHGFIELLIHTAQNLGSRMESEMGRRNVVSTIPVGYVSFFEKVTRFKALLMGAQIHKIESIISTLKQYKLLLDRRLPVNRSIHQRPIITPKTIKRPAYRDLFAEIIRWHEKGQIDWSAYQNLFAIESVPLLFEAYTYYRVLENVNRFMDGQFHERSGSESRILKSNFIDQYENEITVVREPTYWTVAHANQHQDAIVNSEAYTVDDSAIKLRGQRGINSNRSPDIVIQIKRPDGSVKLIIMDAKYSYPDKSFRDYLPALTMKYVHGIHRLSQQESLISSLTVLYPDDNGAYRDFHHGPFGIFGANSAKPSLICCGVILGDDRQTDLVERLVRRTLELEGIKPLVLRVLSTDLNVA